MVEIIDIAKTSEALNTKKYNKIYKRQYYAFTEKRMCNM